MESTWWANQETYGTVGVSVAVRIFESDTETELCHPGGDPSNVVSVEKNPPHSSFYIILTTEFERHRSQYYILQIKLWLTGSMQVLGWEFRIFECSFSVFLWMRLNAWAQGWTQQVERCLTNTSHKLYNIWMPLA